MDISRLSFSSEFLATRHPYTKAAKTVPNIFTSTMKVFLALILLLRTVTAHVIEAQQNVSIYDLFTHPDIPVLPSLDCSLFNLTTPSHQARDARSSKRAMNLQYILCTITMDGRNQGDWQPFLVQGSLLITSGIPSSATQNGKNPVEVVIVIGNPPANPVAGAIRYTTNRYLNRFVGGAFVNSLLDYAYVGVAGNTISVTVDPRIAAANSLSNFNARTGLAAGVYEIQSGGFQISLVGTSGVAGWADLVGHGYISPYTAPYKAIVSGKVVGRGTTSI